MEKTASLVFLLIACSLVQVNAQCDNFDYSANCYCKNTTIESIELLFPKIKDQIIDRLLLVGMNGWSDLANQLKDQLAFLHYNSDPDLDNIVEITIIFLSVLNPFIERQPSGCAMAAAINASISCIEDVDSGPIYDLLNGDELNIHYERLTKLVLFGAIHSMGFDISEDPDLSSQFPQDECDNNGLDYDFETIWNLRGYGYPTIVKDIVRKLYNSEDFKDRFIALVASYSLLDVARRIRDCYEPLELFEYVYLQYSVPYPECCLGERLNHLQTLYILINNQRSKAFQNVANYFSNSEVCQNLIPQF